MNAALHLEVANLLTQPRHLGILGLLLAVVRECLLRLIAESKIAFAQDVLVYFQVHGRLGHSNALLSDQLERLELEFSAEGRSSSRKPPTVLSLTFTTCLQNLQQPSRTSGVSGKACQGRILPRMLTLA